MHIIKRLFWFQINNDLRRNSRTQQCVVENMTYISNNQGQLVYKKLIKIHLSLHAKRDTNHIRYSSAGTHS